MSDALTFLRQRPLLLLVVGGLALGVVLWAADASTALAATAFVVLGVVLLDTAIEMVNALTAGRWGLDVLAMIAIASTLLVGEYLAALVVCLMLTGGEALEDSAAGRAKRSLSALLERAPQVAHLLLPDGTTRDVAMESVSVGDRLLVRPAEVVPVDGILSTDADGHVIEAGFDESSLTGEPLPVSRRTGDEILSGSAQRPARRPWCGPTATAQDSQYSRILVPGAGGLRVPRADGAPGRPLRRAVHDRRLPDRRPRLVALGRPRPLRRGARRRHPVPAADRGSRGVPGGHVASAAKNGVIVKSGGTIETLGRVRTAAFDKTGTLTYGRPELLEVRPARGADGQPLLDEDELLRITGSAEQYSGHVLAESIRKAAEARGLRLVPATEAREIATHGVTAVLEGREVVVGQGLVRPRPHDRVRARRPRAGESAVYVGVDGVFAGVLLISDRLRANARATLARSWTASVSASG